MAHQSANAQGWRLAALSLTMLLPSLGISVANIALPSLRSAFGVSSQEAQWVVIGYLVVVTATLVTAGRLGDLLGRRRLLLVGIAVFSAASLGAVFAPSIWAIVAARAVQAVGAAMMMSLTVAAVSDAVPPQHTGRAMGLLGTVSAVGTATGPSLGGLLVGAFGWPSIFVLMAGAGALAGLVVAAKLPADRASPRRPAFDIAGAAVLMFAVGAFALATTLSPAGMANGVLAGVAVLGLLAFVAIERRAAAPLVQLAMLRQPGIVAALAGIGLVSAIVMTTLVVGPFYLTGVLGLDTATAGLAMSVGPVVSALTGIPAGRIVDRFGARSAGHVGLGAMLAGTLAMIVLPERFGLAGYIAGLVPITSGYALFQAATTAGLMAGAAAGERGVTSALLALGRNLGLIVGASAMGALFALRSGGSSGLETVFAVASGFVLVAAALSVWAARRGTAG